MGIWGWLANNSFSLLSAIGIIGGLWFTALSFRSEAKTRRIANLINITGSHRDVWKVYFNSPDLVRVFDGRANISKHPINQKEEIFVNMVIAHIATVFYAMKNELVIKQEGLRRDVAQFMSLPIPSAIWGKNKVVQNDDFVAFVESCQNWK
jgi:hypothetical protein